MINWPNYVESSGWVWSPSLLQPWSWTGLATHLPCGKFQLPIFYCGKFETTFPSLIPPCHVMQLQLHATISHYNKKPFLV